MSITKCRECHHDVSSEAQACPHCGCSYPSLKPNPGGGLRAFAKLSIIAGLIFFGYWILSFKPATPSASVKSPAAFVAPTPAKVEPPLHPDVVKARAAVDKISDDNFCTALGKALRNKKSTPDHEAAMIRRAENREGVSDSAIEGIRQRRPVLGMNACAIIAAFGRPDRSNKSVGSYGEHYQVIYEQPKLYLYVENGKLTSWQE